MCNVIVLTINDSEGDTRIVPLESNEDLESYKECTNLCAHCRHKNKKFRWHLNMGCELSETYQTSLHHYVIECNLYKQRRE